MTRKKVAKSMVSPIAKFLEGSQIENTLAIARAMLMRVNLLVVAL